MADTVWHRIDRELGRRKGVHLAPSSWAALGRAISVSSQVLTNWKARRVPPEMHAAVAEALGWTVDRLIGAQEFVDTAKVLHDSVEHTYSAVLASTPDSPAVLQKAIAGLPPELRQLVEAYMDLLPEDRGPMTEALFAKADQMRRHTELVLKRAGVDLKHARGRGDGLPMAPPGPPAPEKTRGTRIEDAPSKPAKKRATR